MPALRSTALLLLAAATAAAAPVPVTRTENEPPAVKARAALNGKVTVRAEGKTLQEAVDMLKEAARVDIVLDTTAVQMMGMDVTTPAVTFEVKDAPLREALTKAFAPVNLRFGVTAAGLVVSTDEGVTVRQLRQRVSVDADNRSFADAIKSLVAESGANVVVDPRIAKKAADEKVTLKLDDVPLETAVRLTAEVAGYAVVRLSNVLFVTTEQRAEKMRPDADKPVAPSPGNPLLLNGDNFVPNGGQAIPAVPVPGNGPVPVPPVLPGN